MVPIGSLSGLLVRVWDAVRRSGLSKLAWRLREYADSKKREAPNLYAFSRAALVRELGRYANRFRDVIEFMEERGWAVKVKNPPDHWQIN